MSESAKTRGCLVEQSIWMEGRIAKLTALLKVAVCPECDGSGGIPHQIAEDAWQEQKCQWCAEVKALEDV